MARPFPNTFDKDSPMSPQSAISYQTNVNRQKTKKWTEAKPVDYGGDDWGDDDDYDLPPPPISKPTGLRQQGQGLANTSKAESPVADNRKYGDLPALPGASNSRLRANSFDADDERRAFSSSSTQPPPASNAPATRFSQITGVPTPRNASGPPVLSISTQQPAQPPVGLRKPGISPVVESPHPDILMPGPGRVNTGESSVTSPISEIRTPSTSSDFHARRDFSPSAVPPPLSTRASPAPQSATDTTPGQRFPARKSSLSQVSGPPLDEIMGSGSQDTTPKPWIGARPASPGTGAKSPISPSKALPFIRPADIYRRAEEERRQSIESAGRPSMDSLIGSKASDRSDSPSKPYTKGGPEIGAARRRASFETDDTSDSGRRLMPMLEPVKERKSEYGFEGFNVNDHGPQQGPSTESRNLDVEDARRQSTSPKLPDLTRVSGFGLDMFSSHDMDAIRKEPETTPTTATLSSPEQDLTLREQPSFGFKSVVHQAFDTTDDHSLPDTPASRSGSGVNRTDSESTGTGGISPIMSRVSSTAVPDTRNRDTSTPAIMEATEPESPERAGKIGIRGDDFAAPQAPGFKPGHRRDISAPSPGNSPARTPDLATSQFVPGSQHAVVDDTPPDVASPTTEEPLQPPRPFAEREHSFRPSLPGGWTSYATTARSETPTQPTVETPVNEVAPAQDHEDYDLTPTTTKRSLPGSALGATFAGATLGGAALGRHDHTSPSQTPVDEGSRALSSPPLSLGSPMSPSGNTYPSQPLEDLPKLEQAPAETQLRPDVVDRPVSTLSIPPPPPPKDTPTSDVVGQSSDYFPRSATPLVETSPADPHADEASQSPTRPQIIPTLSTDSTDYDEENDKLRKEIVKSLTPSPSNATAHTSSAQSDRMDESSLSNPNRESSYLPSEYDNYWATTGQDEEVPAIPGVHRDVSDARSTTEGGTQPGLESPIPAPLSPRRPDESLHPPRPPLQSRFSWEQSSEDVNAGVNRDQGYLTTDTSARGPVASELAGSVVPVEEEKEVAPQSPEPKPASGPPEDHHGARDAALLAGGAALIGGAAAVTYSDKPEEKSRRLSLAEEMDPRVSSNPVSPTPPEDEHPSRSPQHHFPTSPETYQHPPAPPSTVSPVTSSVHPFAAPPPGRLLAFREIVAMKSPQERIKTFDETRHRFAAMDSGLNDWILKLQGQFPDEHGGVTGSWGNSRSNMPSGSARGKFSKATAGGPAPPLQQPYYQQYLNASSPPTPSTPVSGGPRPSPSMPSGSQQGFSSAGSKITTQQVQAKGKELLHTAGIFGGKAGKAGKGLLAKGKNKLRAAGGGDKTSPPSKPKADRRSSWGLPLSMSRSSGRPDAMSRNSRDSTPTPSLGRPRTNTMPSEESPAPQLPAVATGYSLGVMSGALPSEHPEPSRETLSTHPIASPPTSNQIDDVSESETRDALRVPAPIGKHQPSWDPFNATPIAEEDGFQYEERPRPQLSSDPNSNPDALSVPADNLAKSDRSNSSDAQFFDAREDSEDINDDWVMVKPEPEVKESGVGPSVLKPASSVEPAGRQSLDKPTTSILDRPRGSFSLEPSPQLPVQAKTEPDVRRSVDGGPTASILNRPRGSFSYDTPPPVSPAKPVTAPLASPPLSNPNQSSQSVRRPATPPAPTAAAVPASAQRTPSPQKAALVQSEKQSGASSFLPPIRRTSTFGIGFGSRQPKQRFAIEEDEEASPPRVSGAQQEQHVAEPSTAVEQPGQEPKPDHSRALAGAAVGAAVVAGMGSHGKERQDGEFSTSRDASDSENQRFHQAQAEPVPSQRQRAFTAESNDLSPPDDANTWGVRDEVPQDLVHPPLPSSSGKQRQASFPPPGFVTDPAPLKDLGGAQQSSTEPVFAEEPDELSPRDDTNTWGVHDELPPNMIHPPLPGAAGKQRQESFPPLGFAVDSDAHGPSQTTQPVDARSPMSKPPLTVQTGATNTQNQRQASFPPPGFQVDPQAHGPAETIRGVNLTDVAPRTPPAHARTNSNEPGPRPLSFQQTPPHESGHQRQPSLPLSFTREPEEIGPRAGNAGEGSSTQGSDPQRHMSMPPPSLARDPEKEEFGIPQKSAQRLSYQTPQNQNTPPRDPKTMFTPPRADNILQRPEFKESQVEWRPNRPRVVTKPSQSSYSSESYGKEIGILAARTNSWDTQPPPRGNSGSSSYMQRQDSQFSEKGGWSSAQQPKPFEQPPSSAQRYPELFKPGQQQPVVESPRDVDLPAHYYQAPISRTQAFLPRQQTNEYQLPGVGPPEPPVNPSRRNSGFLRDIGGRLSRGSSRERRNSMSRDPDRLSPERGLESRGEYAESSVMSEDGQEQKRRRASFFGHLSRNSYSGQSPPKSRESVIAHHAGSRTDLLITPQPSPVKRSFFGGSSSEQKSAPKKLIRQSTTGTMDSPAKKKEKNRFSALGGFFGKPSPAKSPSQQRPQATRELSHGERQPIESPQPEPQQQRTPNKYQAPDKAQVRAESQSRRGVLSKLSASVASPQEKEKSRRPSAAGLLNGFMGRKSYQKEKGSEDSRSQGSGPQVGPQPLLAQTYTDLQQQSQGQPMVPSYYSRRGESPSQQQNQYQQQPDTQSRSQPREIPFQDPSLLHQDRGRSISREPQYDSVPIPGGYSLVRGQGAMAVPTEYDPRGLSRYQQQQGQQQAQQQVDPRYMQPQQYQNPPPAQNQGSRLSYQSANQSPQGQSQQHDYVPQYTEQPRQQNPDPRKSLSQPQPQLGALETYRDYTNSNRRISHEDILARSPPKPLIDQQRPYQISLPGGEIEDDDEVETPSRSQHPHPRQTSTTSRPQHDAIQRLQQPTLRHPESPAGYPLPEDTVFSPVNPSAVDFPPPPPPKWPGGMDAHYQHQSQSQSGDRRADAHERQTSLSTMDIDGDLDRSNTRRTAVSAISGISAPRPRSGQSQNGGAIGHPHSGGGLNVPSHEQDVGARGVSPSPTPPSPMDEERGGEGLRRTEVEIAPRASMEDLYNASPRLPRSGGGFVESTGNGNGQAYPNANGRPIGKENSRLDIPRDVSRERAYQGIGNGHAGTKHPEEKIYYDNSRPHLGFGQDGPAELEDHETSMSATSYPGQEWNPYAMGAWDDGPDDLGPTASFR
ncbi:hypothetical protein DL98DRAFT_590265 [Cadophora sp. DSE1049]|nr:hypothetical protein DL98DRAFT_590265 [Cadophora sp. DSE1049]